MLTLLLALQSVLLPGAPHGWLASSGPGEYQVALDDAVVHEGRRSLRIAAVAAQPSTAYVTQIVKADRWRGKRVRLSGWMKTDGAGEAALWLSNNDDKWNIISIDNMSDRPVRGTSDFRRYELVIDVADHAMELRFGAKLVGGGKVWIDDFRLEEVDRRTALTAGGYATNDAPTNLGFER
jgi:hypothetical protein